MSTTPDAMRFSASAGVMIAPTTLTGTCTSALTRAAHGTFGMCSSKFVVAMWTLPSTPMSTPAETCTVSTSGSASRMNASVSSNEMEPSTHSTALIRMSTGKSGPTAARTACRIASGNRARFSRDPPYPSVREFARGDRNCAGSQPCPKCRNTMSKPRSRALRAVRPHSSATSAMSSSVMPRTSTPSSRTYDTGPRAKSATRACRPPWKISIDAFAPAWCALSTRRRVSSTSYLANASGSSGLA
nr:hypothetical protein [Cellulomonas sp. C5510]